MTPHERLNKTCLIPLKSIPPQVVRFIERFIKTSSTDIAGSCCEKTPSMDLQNCSAPSSKRITEVTEGR
jgi:hypothetical protein